ncbi:zinc finger, RING/FYVE/PHD-type containing protein [Tanacetum coccineum]
MLSAATANIVSAVCQANDHDFGGIWVPKQKRNTGILEEKKEEHIDVEVVSKKDEKANESGSGSGVILCIDRLREELSCAMYLEICFKPSTISCGHSFYECVRSAADKCGRHCPKCRQREEFMGAFRGSKQPQQIQQQRGRIPVTIAMVNLIAMASRLVKWLIFLLLPLDLVGKSFWYAY